MVLNPVKKNRKNLYNRVYISFEENFYEKEKRYTESLLQRYYELSVAVKGRREEIIYPVYKDKVIRTERETDSCESSFCDYGSKKICKKRCAFDGSYCRRNNRSYKSNREIQSQTSGPLYLLCSLVDKTGNTGVFIQKSFYDKITCEPLKKDIEKRKRDKIRKIFISSSKIYEYNSHGGQTPEYRREQRRIRRLCACRQRIRTGKIRRELFFAKLCEESSEYSFRKRKTCFRDEIRSFRLQQNVVKRDIKKIQTYKRKNKTDPEQGSLQVKKILRKKISQGFFKGFLSLFLFLFFSGCSKYSINLSPLWELDLKNFETKKIEDPHSSIKFVETRACERFIVSFNEKGSIIKKIEIPLNFSRAVFTHNLSICAFYNDYGSVIKFTNLSYNSSFVLRSDAYPVLSSDGEFALLITGEAEGLSLFSIKDKIITPVFRTATAAVDIVSGKDFFVAGFLDGSLAFFDRTLFKSNTPLKILYDNLSLVPLVKKLVVSDDYRFLASRCGFNPEYISIYKIPSLKRIKNIKTGENQRTKFVLSFSPDSSKILSESLNGFKVYSAKTARKLLVFEDKKYFGKRFFSCRWLNEKIFVVSFFDETSKDTVLDIFNVKGSLLLRKNIKEKRLTLLKASDNYILAASDEKILLFSVLKK